MVEQIGQTLAADYPEYVELTSYLKLAAQTWPRYGLSAGDLTKLDPWTLEMIRIALDG